MGSYTLLFTATGEYFLQASIVKTGRIKGAHEEDQMESPCVFLNDEFLGGYILTLVDCRGIFLLKVVPLSLAEKSKE
jgi:hypothetical protein